MSTALSLYADHLSFYASHFHGARLHGLEADLKDPQVLACFRAIVENTPYYVDAVVSAAEDAAIYTPLWGVASGAVVASALDTNKDPSAEKTSIAVLLGWILQGGINSDYAPPLFGSKHLFTLADTCRLNLRQMYEIEREADTLSEAQRDALAKTLNVTPAQLSTFFSDVKAATTEAISSLKLALATSLVISALGAYHGYQRSGGLSALGFALSGSAGLGVALRQGFAKPLPGRS